MAANTERGTLMTREDNEGAGFEDQATQFFADNEENALTEEEGKAKYTYSDKVIKRIQSIGLHGRPKPRFEDIHTTIYDGVKAGQYFDGRLPVLLKKLSMEQLSALYALFGNWYGYLSSQYTLVAAERSEALRQKEMMWSMVRMNYHKQIRRLNLKSFTDQKLSDMARFDRRFVDVSARYEELDTIYKTLQAVLEVAQNDMKVVSREVTIREVLTEADARGRGMGGHAPSRFAVERPQFQRSSVDFDKSNEEQEDADDTEEKSKVPNKARIRIAAKRASASSAARKPGIKLKT
jgi:hypothetical protein